MTQEEEILHVHKCLIAMREADREIMKRFGFTTYRALNDAKERIMGALDKPIEIDGYTLYREDKLIYAIAGGKQIGTKSKLKITQR